MGAAWYEVKFIGIVAKHLFSQVLGNITITSNLQVHEFLLRAKLNFGR